MRRKIALLMLLALLFSGCARHNAEVSPPQTVLPVAEEKPQTEKPKTKKPQTESIPTEKPKAVTAPSKPAEKKTETVPTPAESVPTEKPKAVPTPETACTVSISCGAIAEGGYALAGAPADGIILKGYKVTFAEGESAFDALLRATRENKIHMEFSETPGLNSKYVEGIANIYEFDCGELSGWTYKVNGEFPGIGSSSCILHDGDVVEFLYTCELGRDVGNEKALSN